MSIATEISRLQSAKAAIKTAIENKGVTVGTITLGSYAGKIDQIASGGVDISDADAVVGNVLSGKTFYATSGGRKTGTMLNNGSQNLVITNIADVLYINEGYHNGNGTAYIDSTENAKLISSNIKSGITILGVTGSTNVVDTTSGDAIAGDILATKKAWVDGLEVTGTMTNRGEVDTDITTKAQVVTIASGYHNGNGTVQISSTEQAKIIATNIKKDISILGVTGTLEGSGSADWTNYIAIRNGTKTTLGTSDIDLTTITNLRSAFRAITSLTSVNVSLNAISGNNCAEYLFQSCTSITTATINAPNANNDYILQYAFNLCTALTSAVINIPAYNGAWGVVSIFAGCTNLTTVTLNASSANNLNALRNIFSSATPTTITITGMYENASLWANIGTYNPVNQASLTNIVFECDIRANLSVNSCTNLTFASVVGLLGKLYDYSSGSAKTITFNRSFTGLSQGDYNTIAAAVTTANSRNWTVSGLTYSL